MRHGVGLSTSSDSELITQLLALTPPMEELDAPDWVARSVLRLSALRLHLQTLYVYIYTYFSLNLPVVYILSSTHMSISHYIKW